MWWSCADSRDFDGTHDYALHQLNLEVVCAAPLRTLGRERCRASKRRGKILRAELAAEIRGPSCRIFQKRIDGPVDRLRCPGEALALVPPRQPLEQHRSGEHQGDRIGPIPSG